MIIHFSPMPSRMHFLDLSLSSPAHDLAADEALLDAAEEGAGGEVLRCWESSQIFVALGYANRIATEVNVDACRARGIPILRRCSGGGTVLQGPGCLNYSIILAIDETGPTGTITGANEFVMRRNRAALASVLGQPITVQGHTDLTLGALKFSGNAQRRKRRYLLFHGTFLLHFDLALLEACLALPSQEPDYRQHRRHRDFVTNLNVPADTVKAALQHTWNASTPLHDVPHERIEHLVRDKYGREDWNAKY